MSAASLYPVRPEVAARTLTDEATYKAMYQQSVVNPEGFWREPAWVCEVTRRWGSVGGPRAAVDSWHGGDMRV